MRSKFRACAFWRIKPTLIILAAATAICVAPHAMATKHACAQDARERAYKLLMFHTNGDDRIVIDNELTQVPDIRNPASPAQRFDVLEIWGSIYKGQYRLRFIYAQIEGCVLMGEEVLQYADL